MGKGIMFMLFVWMAVSIAGGVMQGSNPLANTALTTAITIDEEDTINVTSTEGFADSGWVTIQDERISYPDKTATTFRSSFAHKLGRGAEGTEAIAHSAGEIARTIEAGMLNQSLNYQIATLTDSAGVLGFVTIPFRFISLLLSFFVLPLSFLGTDLQILTYIWGILSIGIIVSLGLAIVGGRRV